VKKLFAFVTVLGLLLPNFALAADDGVPRITKEELRAKMVKGENVIVLDVRVKGSYEGSKVKIKGSLRISPDEIEAKYKDLPQDREIITYCTCTNEHTSARVARILMDKGFKNVKALLGGFSAWVEAGYPTEPK